MKFETPLIRGTLVKRYKRFLADVILESGETIVAHCANTGSMRSCWQEGDSVYLSHHDSPKRKLKYTWELTEVPGGFIGINTAKPNRIAYEAIIDGKIPELAGYKTVKREVKISEGTRIDLALESPDRPTCYTEIKNVTFLDGGRLKFPDAVTTRGRKHLVELVEQRKQGKRAVMLYLANRPEAEVFAPARDIDPDYAGALELAMESGVEALCYRINSGLDEMTVGERIPISDVDTWN